MSGSSSSTVPATAPTGDPSMEDILASIRRILSDDEVKVEETPVPASAARASDPDDEELLLDSSMMVTETGVGAHAPLVADSSPGGVIPAPALASLVAPEAAAAAASSVDDLVRTLSTDRAMMVSSRGPTIEDIVRQEIRPLLKAWLDVNLPPLVDRLVRTEIERVVGRART